MGTGFPLGLPVCCWVGFSFGLPVCCWAIVLLLPVLWAFWCCYCFCAGFLLLLSAAFGLQGLLLSLGCGLHVLCCWVCCSGLAVLWGCFFLAAVICYCFLLHAGVAGPLWVLLWMLGLLGSMGMLPQVCAAAFVLVCWALVLLLVKLLVLFAALCFSPLLGFVVAAAASSVLLLLASIVWICLGLSLWLQALCC